jgi:hypothetical protein
MKSNMRARRFSLGGSGASAARVIWAIMVATPKITLG